MLLTERLTTAGRLAAGVAHELNNPLATIAGCAEALRERAQDPALAAVAAFKDFPAYLGLIEDEAYRCKEITASLLQFIREPGSRRAPTDLNALVDKTLELLAPPAALRGEPDASPTSIRRCPTVVANEGQLRQVFLGLSANALEAMEGRGTLLVLHAPPGSDEVEIAFEDEGPGIPAARARAHLRPVLHDQAAGPGHRPRAGHRPGHRRRPRRAHRGRSHGRRRHRVPGGPSRRALPKRRAMTRADPGPGGRRREESARAARAGARSARGTSWTAWRTARRRSIGCAEEIPDVLVLDMKMPRVEGIEVLRALQEHPEAPQVIVMTGFREVSTAVEAMKLGAYDYLTKPARIEELDILDPEGGREGPADPPERRAPRSARLGAGRRRHRRRRARAMEDVLRMVDRVAPTDSSVLILGESGTGKELVARALHERSARSGQAFVPIHCGALPREVLEWELFGHEKGAFTGAVDAKPGLIELAEGGTLFLDEIGEMEPESQVKLLRVLEIEGVLPRGRDPPADGGHAAGGRHQPRPRRGDPGRTSSARTSTTASTPFPSCCRRSASVARTSVRSRSTSWSGTPPTV